MEETTNSTGIFAEMEELAAAIERDPAGMAGSWARWRGGCFDEVRVDYGSGMGDYIVALAAGNPETLFVGVERELFCIVKAARKAIDAGLANVVFVPSENRTLAGLFAPCELSRIYINFPTPYPHARDADKRLTHLDNLLECRGLLAQGGQLFLKTDSVALFDFARAQLDLAGYRIGWQTSDLRVERPEDPQTGYERRTIARGAKILALEAEPTGLSGTPEQTAALSLFDYLPEDLESLDYVPLDMERSVRSAIDAKRRVEEGRRRREGGR
ncbi:MAG: methyltransferase [bacterium]|nr:methyltransferase [bacterium]